MIKAIASTRQLYAVAVVLSGLVFTAGRSPAQTNETAATYTEVTRKQVELTDQKLTLIQIAPPTLPKAPPPAPPPALTVDEQAMVERRSKKEYVETTFSITVHTGDPLVAEIRWEKDGVKYLAYSNADLRILGEPAYFEDETSVYSWFPFTFIDDHTNDFSGKASVTSAAVAAGLNPADKTAHFVPAGAAAQLPVDDPALRILDSAHAFYQVRFDDLLARYKQRLADQAAQELAAAQKALLPKPERKLYFWITPERRKQP
jgi:hypothetical protein